MSQTESSTLNEASPTAMQASVEILRSTTVCSTGHTAHPSQQLSPIDLSPLLLKTLNCPTLKFEYALDFEALKGAAADLLLEIPILGGRVKKAAKPALYCIDLSATAQDSGILLAEASTAAPSSAISLNGALAAPFSMTSGKLQLPPWYQPLDMARLLSGKEPLLKLQLTHCSDGGSILAATMPHLLADSHSTTLLLTRLAQAYKKLTRTGSDIMPAATGAAPDAFDAAAAAADPWAAGPVGPHTAGSWRKAHVVPADAAAKDWQSPGTLKALSLELQSPEPSSLGTALRWLSAAVKEGVAAAQRFPGAASSLTSCLLHIPKADVQQLKAMAAAGGMHKAARFISTNDAVSALVWLTFCDVRGRPLPGSSSSSPGSISKPSLLSRFGCTGGDSSSSSSSSSGTTPRPSAGVLGLAVDLRQNCRDLREQLPADYFGNAAWCLHIPSLDPANAPKEGLLGGTSGSWAAGDAPAGYVPALQAAAGAVRGALNSFRQTPEAGSKLLQLIAAQQAAPTSVLVRNLSRLAVQVDAFVTSWNFPIDGIDFGSGPTTEYSCLVRPSPPWQAAVLPKVRGRDEGGVQLLLTVPGSAVPALRRSGVLQQLVPHATLSTA